jgi:hypothetical protein
MTSRADELLQGDFPRSRADELLGAAPLTPPQPTTSFPKEGPSPRGAAAGFPGGAGGGFPDLSREAQLAKVQRGSGFMQFADPALGPEANLDIFVGNVRQYADFERNFKIDMAAKGTPAYMLSGLLGRGFKRWGKRPSAAGFVAGAVLGDVLGEVSLQEAEVLLGRRKSINWGEVAASAGFTAAFGASATFITRMVARIGAVAPRVIKELTFSNILRQARLLIPRATSSLHQRSSDFGLGKKIQRSVVKRLKPSRFSGSGVNAEDMMVPTAIKNLEWMRKATAENLKMDIKPIFDTAIRTVERFTKQPETRRAANVVMDTMADLETKLAPLDYRVTPILANKILQELREPIKAALRRSGEPVKASTLETITTQMRMRVSEHLKEILHKQMDKWVQSTVGGAGKFSMNAQITKETLQSAEDMIRNMSDRGVVNFVRQVHKTENEGVLALLSQFDKMNGTNFVDETFEPFLNRGLTVDQLKRVQGLARTVAPFLVIMRQVATKVAAPLTRPGTAAAGALTTTGIREGRKATTAFEEEMRKARLDLEAGLVQ